MKTITHRPKFGYRMWVEIVNIFDENHAISQHLLITTMNLYKHRYVSASHESIHFGLDVEDLRPSNLGCFDRHSRPLDAPPSGNCLHRPLHRLLLLHFRLRILWNNWGCEITIRMIRAILVAERAICENRSSDAVEL